MLQVVEFVKRPEECFQVFLIFVIAEVVMSWEKKQHDSFDFEAASFEQ